LPKATVKCAAANDDDDLGILFDMKSEGKKAKKASAADEKTSSAGGSQNGGIKKEKEFAWMDSDDEEEKKGDDGEEEKDEEDMDVTVEALDTVHSFGRMVLLAPSLQKRLKERKVSPEEVAAACRALTRTKFFDHDILKFLHAELRQLVAKDKLGIAQTTDAIQCLGCLNAYDKSFFQEVAKAYKAKTSLVEPEKRMIWSEAYSLLKHDGDKDFVQLLEVPPLLPSHPSFRRVRCKYLLPGPCASGEACTFSHDPRAPMSLMAGASEETWRNRTQVMTEDQWNLGRGAYGAGKGGMR